MKPSIRDAVTAVCIYHNMKEERLLSRRRDHDISHPRQVAMFIARKMGGRSLRQIARHFNLDHTTVQFAEGQVGRRIGCDPSAAEQVRAICEIASVVASGRIGRLKDDCRLLVEGGGACLVGE